MSAITHPHISLSQHVMHTIVRLRNKSPVIAVAAHVPIMLLTLASLVEAAARLVLLIIAYPLKFVMPEWWARDIVANAGILGVIVNLGNFEMGIYASAQTLFTSKITSESIHPVVVIKLLNAVQ